MLQEKPERASKHFECLCGRVILVPSKTQGKLWCFRCHLQWKLHKTFASGLGEAKGYQMWYTYG